MAWLNSICTECGKRQFGTPSGPTCEDGHGGADGLDMTNEDIRQWNRVNSGREPPMPDLPRKGPRPKTDPGHEDDNHHFGPGDLRRGDRVLLTSGGFTMTVEAVSGISKETISTIWHDERGKLRRAELHIHLLKPAPPDWEST